MLHHPACVAGLHGPGQPPPSLPARAVSDPPSALQRGTLGTGAVGRAVAWSGPAASDSAPCPGSTPPLPVPVWPWVGHLPTEPPCSARSLAHRKHPVRAGRGHGQWWGAVRLPPGPFLQEALTEQAEGVLRCTEFRTLGPEVPSEAIQLSSPGIHRDGDRAHTVHGPEDHGVQCLSPGEGPLQGSPL